MKIDVALNLNGAILVPTPEQYNIITEFVTGFMFRDDQPKQQEAKPLEVVAKSGKLKHKSKKIMGSPRWTVDQTSRLLSRHAELKAKGIKTGKIFQLIAQEVGHTPHACLMRVYALARQPLVPNPKPNENPASPVREPVAVTAGRKDDDDSFEFPDQQI